MGEIEQGDRERKGKGKGFSKREGVSRGVLKKKLF